MPLFTVASRCHADHFLEGIVEIVEVIETDRSCDVFDRAVGMDQQRLRLADPAPDQVLHRGKSDLLLKKMGQVVWIDVEDLGDGSQGQVIRIILVDVVLDLLPQFRFCQGRVCDLLLGKTADHQQQDSQDLLGDLHGLWGMPGRLVDHQAKQGFDLV